MQIRAARLDDIPQLCELLALLFDQEIEFQPDRARQSAGLREIIASPERGQILVLDAETSIVGMVALLWTISTALGGRVAWLEDLIVHPAHRGGAGSQLLQGAIAAAQSAGCRRITLLTDGTNAAAQKFYARNGFVASDMVPMRLLLAESD